MKQGAHWAFGLLMVLGMWGCDPTTLPEYVLDAEVDAEIDMEVDLGPSACERACTAIADCAATEDFCVGLSDGDSAVVIDLCAPECASKPALATIINGSESCSSTVAFFEGTSAEFQRICNTPEGGAPDTGVEEADMAVEEADMAVEEADMAVEEADMAVEGK